MDIHHDIVIGFGNSEKNIADAERAIDNLEHYLEGIGIKADKASEVYQRAFDGISENDNLAGMIQTQEQMMAQLLAQYKKTAQSIKEIPLGQKNPELIKQLAQVKTEIQAEADALQALKDKFNGSNKAVVPFRQQMKQLTNQLNQMRLEGKENTEEFKRLEAELGRLATAARETSKSMLSDSTGATQWSGMIEGVNGLMGAYSAASGVVGVFTNDQEKLMKVQTKMQSLMAILTGMQSVSNTLHSTSTFRLRTLTAAQATYRNVMAATTRAMHGFNISMRAANVSAKVLMGTLTLGLTVAIGAIIRMLSKWSEKRKEAGAAFTEIGNSAADATAKFTELQFTFKNLGDDMSAKTKFLKDNKKAFEELGVEINNVNDLENLMIKNSDKYIAAQIAKAKADVTRTKFTELVKRAAEKDAKIDATPEKSTSFVQDGVHPQFGYAIGHYEEVDNPKLAKLKAERADLQTEMEKVLGDIQKYNDEAASLLAEGGIKATNAVTDTTEGLKSAESAYAKFLESYNKEVETQTEKGIEDELRLIEYRKQKKIEAITKEYEEVKKAMVEAGKDTGDLDSTYNAYVEAIEAGAAAETAKVKQTREKERADEASRLEKELQEYEGYFKRRERIVQEYRKKEAQFFNEDGSLKAEYSSKGYNADTVRSELDRDRTDALSSVDMYFAERESEFQIWCDRIADESLESLNDLLTEAEAELARMRAEGGTDAAKMATAYSKVHVLNEKVAAAKAKKALEPSPRAIDSWKDLQDVLRDCTKGFEEVGDSVGGIVGDIMKSAGQIATSTISMINGIVQLTDTSIKGTEETAKAGARAIKAVERASVILAIIQVALEVISKIVNLVTGNAVANREAAKATDAYYKSLERLANSKALDAFKNTFGENELGRIREYHDQVNMLTKDMQSQLKGLSGATSDFRSKWQKLWGSDKNKFSLNPDDYMTDGVFDGDKLQKWYDAYGDKLKAKDKEMVQNLIADWNEYQKALEGITSYVESLFGDMSDSIADKMVSAFAESGDAAFNFAEISKDMAKTVAKSYVKSILAEKVFTKKLEENVKNALSTGDTQSAINQVADAVKEANELAPTINEYLKGIGGIVDLSDRSGASAGIASASQDTIDELNGRATAIQGQSYSTMISAKSLVVQCAEILSVLYDIKDDTSRLENIDNNMRSIRTDLDEISTRGVRLR